MSVHSLAADPVTEGKPLALLAEDDKALRLLLEHQLISFGYEVVATCDGQEAFTRIQELGTALDVIVLDREMPNMDGIEVVRRLKDLPGLGAIPVIMQTSAGKPSQVQEGIDAGVFYYLVKPIEQTLLGSVLSAAMREARLKRTLSMELLRQRHAFGLLNSCTLQYRTLAEAEDIASFLASCYPDPDRVLGGMIELLVNAVEHGNLGIGYEGKTILLKENRLSQEIARRLELTDFAALQAEVSFKRKADGLYVQITDQGKGFDWRQYLRVNPARASDSHGRGIAQANLLSFDKLVYNAAGNQVMGVVLNPRSTY